MPITTKNFEKYYLFHNAKTVGNTILQAKITCMDASNNYVAVLQFYRSDVVIDSHIDSSGRLILCFSIERLQEIITTLRYEEPLSVSIVTDASGAITDAFLHTRVIEHIGEQEGV